MTHAKYILLLWFLCFQIIGIGQENQILPDNTRIIESLPIDISAQWQYCRKTKTTLGQSPSCQLAAEIQPENIQQTDTIILKMSFILDDTLHNQVIGIRINELKGADELYLNGHLIGKTGEFPPSYENASYYPRYYLLPNRLIHSNKVNELKLRIYNKNITDHLSQIKSQLYFAEDISKDLILSEIIYFIIAAMLLVIAIYKLYYFIRIPSSQETLSLALFCISTALAISLQSQIFLLSGFDLNNILRLRIVLYTFAQISLLHILFIIFSLTFTTIKRFILTFYSVFGISALIWPQIDQLEVFFYLSQVIAIFLTLSILINIYLIRSKRLTNTQRWLSIALAIYSFCNAAEVVREQILNYQLVFWQSGTLFIISAVCFALTAGLSTTHKYWQYFKGSTYDHLTGTLLRPIFIRRLSEEMQRCQRGELCLLVAVLDIDQFKTITQSYGHNIGDRTVLVISAILTRELRQFDLICRLSEDEFCIAATLPSDEDATGFLLRLHEEINNANLTLDNNQILNLQTTTGAVLFNAERHKAPEVLLYDSEHAVTEAKMKKRGSIQWFDTENPPLQFTF